MNLRIVLIFVCTVLTTGACNINAVHDERPARIIDQSDPGRARLQQVVSGMLSGAEVTLAEDALTESSHLVVERRRIRSVEHPPLPGRDFGLPERFQLVKSGRRCLLIHENSGARSELPQTKCVAE